MNYAKALKFLVEIEESLEVAKAELKEAKNAEEAFAANTAIVAIDAAREAAWNFVERDRKGQ